MSKSSGSYDPKAIEGPIYEFWEAGGWFHAEPDPQKTPYTIVIPPPNVTGALHLGHALNNTLQDVLIRRKRMQGYNACWLPGTDHAGIATQATVEKRIFESEGKNRHDLGRDELVKRIWEWKDQYEQRILGQLRKMGCSCDWERTRFTLDDQCAKAVYETFFRLFKDGLIYRGLRLVNWDPKLQTAVADDEVEHITVKGNLWHVRYRIEGSEDCRIGGGEGADASTVSSESRDRKSADHAHSDPSSLQSTNPFLTIATTRPETMLGDTALAVHPDDERYQHLIGKHVILPLTGRKIPIIADGLLVDPAFGTGVVKVTPAHDPNDYDCGQRNALPMINILTKDGRIRDDAEGKELFGAYAGMERYAARKQIVKDLEASGELEKAEPHEHPVGHSDRSKTPIEPMLSEQWFVKMAPLAEPALEAVRDERVRFFPERYAKTYLDWLGEKRDWCISRQLWWGHRIPVWHRRLTKREWNTKGRPGWSEADSANMTDYSVATIVSSATGAQIEWDEYALVFWSEDDELYDCFICVKEHCDGAQEFIREIEAAGYEQDPDVLDTWFSSALWPHSTFGWPEDDQSRARQEAEGTSGAETTAKHRNAAQDPGVRHPDASGQDATSAGYKPAPQGSSAPNPEPQTPNPKSSTRNPQPSPLDSFYPTNVLSTARDIISLWVARMVLTGLYNVGRVPFPHVCIHPVIQDGTGRRMSKTAGNGLDPLDLIERYGADAMRYTLAGMAGETQDARVPMSYACPHCSELTAHSSVVPHNKVPRDIHEAKCKSCGKEFATAWANDDLKAKLGVALDTSERFELGRNFCNKLWQAATGLVLPSVEGSGFGVQGSGKRSQGSEDSRIQGKSGGQALSLSVTTLAPEQLSLEDRWILSRLQRCIREVDRRLEAYQFSDAMSALYSFFWGEFCDWYLELVKPKLQAGAGDAANSSDASPDPGVRHGGTDATVTIQVMAWTLDQILRLFHPVMPFVTEALWKKLNAAAPWRGVNELAEPGEALIVASWPHADSFWVDEDAEARMARLQDAIRALRDVRARVNGIRAQARETVLKTLPRAVLRCDGAFLNEFANARAILSRLGQCDEIEIGTDVPTPPNAAGKVFSGFAVYVPLAGLADLDLERKRLAKEIDETSGHIKRTEGKLSNKGFVANAPAELVERERARVAELKEKLAALQENLGQLGE